MARPEDRLQIRCAMFAKSHVALPTFWTALEHGRRHSGTAIQRAAEWQRLARKGVRTGLPDLIFITHGFVLAVELKVGSSQSETQKVTETALLTLGHGYVIARSVEQLGEALERHGIPLASGWRIDAQRHDAALDGEPKPARKPSKPRAAKPTRSQIARGNRIALALATGAGE